MSEATEVRIRRATLADLDALLALEALFTTDQVTRRAMRRFLRVPTAWVWVAVKNRVVVGSCIVLTRVSTRAARVYSLVVAPAARGLGLGHRLLETAERKARREGRERMILEVALDNAAARALYERRGYRWLRDLADYYEDGSAGLRLALALR